MSLFEELKRRNVFRVGMAYAVAAWILLQLTDVVGEILNLPAWAGQFILLGLVVGFIPALIIAWAYELTPEGVKRESEVDRSQSVTHQTGRSLNNTIIVLMAVAIAYLLFDKFSPGTDPKLAQSSAPPKPELAADEQLSTGAAPDEMDTRPSIAVLPFENRSQLDSDAFFVAGIHDDLLTNLARIGDLKVISRTSVSRYANTGKSMPEIARELGVSTIMEGAVQRAGDTVRINVQLIDAGTDEHLWAEIFDRELTAENLFAIQSEISEAIASALQSQLTPQEADRIDARPTSNLAAYTAYLRGRSLMESRNSADLDQARAELERAVELDPEFALGWVAVAEVIGFQQDYGSLDPMVALQSQQRAVDRALNLDKQLGEAYSVQATVFARQRRRSEAEKAFVRGIELAPGYANAYHWYAILLAREPHSRLEAESLLQKALELDPLSSVVRSRLGVLYRQMGRFDDAERQMRRVLELDPEFAPALARLAEVQAEAGRYDLEVQLLVESIEKDPGNLNAHTGLVWPYAHLKDMESLAPIRKAAQELDPDNPQLAWFDMVPAMLNQQYAAALEHNEWMYQRLGADPFVYRFRGYILNMMKDYDGAKAAWEVSHPEFYQRSSWQQGIERDPLQGCFMAWVLLQTGEVENGRALLDMTNDYMSNELPRFVDHAHRLGQEWCLVIDDPDAAMDLIEQRVAHRHFNGWFFWELHPQMEPLYGTPRFQAALKQVDEELVQQRENLARLKAEGAL